MGSPTRTYMNWVGVTATPQGGATIPIQSVTSVQKIRSNKVMKFYGDNRSYAAVCKSVEKERGLRITTGDAAVLDRIPEDTPCTITATLLDPRNGAAPGGGAFSLTLVNAILEKNDVGGENNKFASGTITFTSFSTVDSNGNEIDPMQTVYL